MTGTDIGRAAQLLTEGKLVAIPTETVYGLAANAYSEAAVLRIYAAKDRPFFDPLIVHIGRLEQIEQIATDFPEKARLLAEKFWPGPLTLILSKSLKVPDLVTSGLPFVGVRMPRHDLTHRLLNDLDFPVAAPSANLFGYVSPTTAEHVSAQLKNSVDYILDGGPCEVGIESTIVSFADVKRPVLLRYGAISQNEIEDLIGPVGVRISFGSKPEAPGQLDRHYATSKPLTLTSATEALPVGNAFILGFGEDPQAVFNYNLSPTSSLSEAARNLFGALRLADESDYDQIVAVTVPDEGIGKAINDRLRRAAVL